MLRKVGPGKVAAERQLGISHNALQAMRTTIERNAQRVACLGQWPEYMEPSSLLERIPKPGDTNAPGFDAGIACAMDLIPRGKQLLAATLHANYSKAAVERVKEEAAIPDADLETIWWLAACSICKEGGIDETAFLGQIRNFKILAKNPQKRLAAAQEEFFKMTHSFNTEKGFPYGEEDGCIQGAYIAGHRYGVRYSKEDGIYFIGTYEDSLGLENFPWSDQRDEKNRTKSGPVFGNIQYVKCADMEELLRTIEVVKARLGERNT
jgi:hypothetical protein